MKIVHLKMSEDFAEGSTHTGDAFVDFAYDLLEYGIRKFGYEWIVPPDFKRSTKKIFKESFGDAVILFRNRHAKEFEERLDRFVSIEDEDGIVSFLRQFCKRTFKGNVPLMEFIAYCAFLLDVGIFFFSLEDPEGVYQLADETFGVFYNYVEKFFTIVGGWHALFRVAEQYVNFMNLTSPSFPFEPASGGMKVSKL